MKKLILFASLVIILVSTSACSLNSNSENPSDNSTNNQPQESQQTNQVEEETSEKHSTDENSKIIEEKDTKIFKGDGFTLEYPKDLIATEEGLWTKDRYDRHLQNIENNTPSSFPFPDIKIESIDSADSLETYIADYYKIDDFDYTNYSKNGPNSELIWMEKITLNTYDAMIVSNNEHIGTNTYFIKDSNKIHVFTAYKEMIPYIFFVETMSTLKFD